MLFVERAEPAPGRLVAGALGGRHGLQIPLHLALRFGLHDGDHVGRVHRENVMPTEHGCVVGPVEDGPGLGRSCRRVEHPASLEQEAGAGERVRGPDPGLHRIEGRVRAIEIALQSLGPRDLRLQTQHVRVVLPGLRGGE